MMCVIFVVVGLFICLSVCLVCLVCLVCFVMFIVYVFFVGG